VYQELLEELKALYPAKKKALGKIGKVGK
jgi:hypothetical protein